MTLAARVGKMRDEEDNDFDKHLRGWTKDRIIYELGFRVALICVLGVLSYLIFFAAGAFGGSLGMTIAQSVPGG